MTNSTVSTLAMVPSGLQEIAADDAKQMGFVPVDPAQADKLRCQAASEAATLLSLANDPDALSRAANEIARIGIEQMQATTHSSALLARRMPRSTKGQAQLSDSMVTLHDMLVELDPERANSRMRRMFGWAPGAKRLGRYVRKAKTAEDTLRGIERSLLKSEATLVSDNEAFDGAIAQMRLDLAAQSENVVYLRELYGRLRAQYDAADAETQAAMADLLYEVEQRYMALQTDMVVTVQGMVQYRALLQGNELYLRTSEVARTTTIKALRTQAAIAIGADNQRRLLEQTAALRKAVNGAMASSGRAIDEQATMIREQASTPVVDFEVLRKSFADTLRGMQTIAETKAAAVESMVDVIAALESLTPELRGMMEASLRADGYTLEAPHAVAVDATR